MENATYNNLLFRTLAERRAIKAAIPVRPFGSPIKSEPWEVFREETGVAVIIDSAAAFDTIRATSVPAVVNLHATKVLGVGEGGFVFSTDTAFIEEVHKRANFSFWNSREATVRAMNGKISEYAAAVSLAALDDWPARRGDYARVASAYRETFTGEFGIVLQRDFASQENSPTR